MCTTLKAVKVINETFTSQVGLPGFPSKIIAHKSEGTTIDSIFAIPAAGNITATLYVPEEYLLKIVAHDEAGNPLEFSVADAHDRYWFNVHAFALSPLEACQS